MADVPDFYTDSFRVTFGPFGSAMTFGLNPPHPSPGQQELPRDVVRLRMSLEHVKVMTMILKRNLKAYEDQMGVITIPREVFRGLGLSPEDW